MNYTTVFAVACFSFFNFLHSMEFNTEPNSLEQRMVKLEQENAQLKKLCFYQYKSISRLKDLLVSMRCTGSKKEILENLYKYRKYQNKSKALLLVMNALKTINEEPQPILAEKDLNKQSVSQALKALTKELEEDRNRKLAEPQETKNEEPEANDTLLLEAVKTLEYRMQNSLKK